MAGALRRFLNQHLGALATELARGKYERRATEQHHMSDTPHTSGKDAT